MKVPDERGMVTAAVIALVFFDLGLMAFCPDLRKDELFKTLSTAIVVSAFVGGVIAFNFANSKNKNDADK